MSKQDLIDIVSEETGLSKTDTKIVLDSILENIKLGTKKHGKVSLIGFGNFEAKERPARSGVTKLGGKETAWKTPAKTVPAFKAGKAFKDIF